MSYVRYNSATVSSMLPPPLRISSSVPSIRILPFPIRMIRLASASISCISWVVSITVVPCVLFCFRIKSRTASFDTASSPMVGSSRNRILGRCRREAAISQRIRCPRESCLAGERRSSARSSNSVNSSRLCLYRGSEINVNNLTQATTTYSVSFNWHGIPCAFLYL